MKPIALLLLACLLATAAFLAGRQSADGAGSPESEASGMSAEADVSSASTDLDADAGPAAGSASDVAMQALVQAAPAGRSALLDPPPETAAREVIEALEARALGGDVLAACRLVKELVRCKSVENWTEHQESAAISRMAALAKEGEDLSDSARQLEEIVSYNNAAKQACEGIERKDLAKAPRYLLTAARLGHVPSMQAFAAGVMLDGEGLVSQPDLYAEYRRHAWPMFMRAFEAGHPGTVQSWNWALNSRGFAFFGAVIPESWRMPDTATALRIILQKELGEIPRDAGYPPSLSVQDIGRAEDLYRRHFQGSPWLRRKEFQPPPGRGVAVERHELKLENCEPPSGI